MTIKYDDVYRYETKVLGRRIKVAYSYYPSCPPLRYKPDIKIIKCVDMDTKEKMIYGPEIMERLKEEAQENFELV